MHGVLIRVFYVLDRRVSLPLLLPVGMRCDGLSAWRQRGTSRGCWTSGPLIKELLSTVQRRERLTGHVVQVCSCQHRSVACSVDCLH